MGATVSAGVNNRELVDNLLEADYIKSLAVERVFRAVDRGQYFTPESRDNAYKDLAWKYGNVHISAPCIYSEVMENLQLGPGMSFLNLGSGTGYLSTMAGLILGAYGLNHGIEVHEDVVEYAQRKLDDFLENSPAIDEFEFCQPKFVVGNCLNLRAETRLYDRVYCGAACPENQEHYMKNLIKVGGILVMPINNQLLQIYRISEELWETRTVLPVSFASLVTTSADNIEPVALPDAEPLSLQEICRYTIRSILRKKINTEHPGIRCDTLQDSKMRIKKRTLRKFVIPIFGNNADNQSDITPEDLNGLRDFGRRGFLMDVQSVRSCRTLLELLPGPSNRMLIAGQEGNNREGEFDDYDEDEYEDLDDYEHMGEADGPGIEGSDDNENDNDEDDDSDDDENNEDAADDDDGDDGDDENDGNNGDDGDDDDDGMDGMGGSYANDDDFNDGYNYGNGEGGNYGDADNYGNGDAGNYGNGDTGNYGNDGNYVDDDHFDSGYNYGNGNDANDDNDGNNENDDNDDDTEDGDVPLDIFDETTQEETTLDIFDATTQEETTLDIFDATTQEETTLDIFDATTQEETTLDIADDTTQEEATLDNADDTTLDDFEDGAMALQGLGSPQEEGEVDDFEMMETDTAPMTRSRAKKSAMMSAKKSTKTSAKKGGKGGAKNFAKSGTKNSTKKVAKTTADSDAPTTSKMVTRSAARNAKTSPTMTTDSTGNTSRMTTRSRARKVAENAASSSPMITRSAARNGAMSSMNTRMSARMTDMMNSVMGSRIRPRMNPRMANRAGARMATAGLGGRMGTRIRRRLDQNNRSDENMGSQLLRQISLAENPQANVNRCVEQFDPNEKILVRLDDSQPDFDMNDDSVEPEPVTTYSDYMREKIKLLPLPTALKYFLNFNRDL